ncbi:arginyltransferase [bacterium]|jgi:arginine-tRNA-protein transferase|nr:arginyltransferase [bacterium]
MRIENNLNEVALSEMKETLVVYEEEEPCPYIEGRTARMPLHLPLVKIGVARSDRYMADGFRRSGGFLYRTNCTGCQACEAIRLNVDVFKPNRSQKRALKKGNDDLRIIIGPPISDQRRTSLFNKHRNIRGLNRNGADIDEDEFRMFLSETCLNTFEMAYYHGEELIGVAICDLGETSMSAVYTFYDPDFSMMSPGTYSVMKQIEFCVNRGLQYLYLGYFIADSSHMRYKQNFRPHERLQKGEWNVFE